MIKVLIKFPLKESFFLKLVAESVTRQDNVSNESAIGGIHLGPDSGYQQTTIRDLPKYLLASGFKLASLKASKTAIIGRPIKYSFDLTYQQLEKELCISEQLRNQIGSFFNKKYRYIHIWENKLRENETQVGKLYTVNFAGEEICRTFSSLFFNGSSWRLESEVR